MNGLRSRWVGLATIGLATAISLWLEDLYHPRIPPPRQAPGHVPESVLEDVRLVQYDLQGAVRYRLRSPRLVQFLDDHALEAVAPRVEFYAKASAPVTVRAHHGWMSAERDHIELLNGVAIQQPETAEATGFTAHTEELVVLPHQQVARTEHPLQIRGRGFEIEGVGGELLLAQGVLRLHRQVRSRFWRAPPEVPS